MMRVLSSELTTFYKFVFPVLWLGLFGIGTLTMFATADSSDPALIPWLFAAAWLVVAALIYAICGRLKKVSLEDGQLLITNYVRETRVSLADLASVSHSAFLQPELVWLHFRRPTEFGETVQFLAPVRLFPFGVHPLARELQSFVDQKAPRGRHAISNEAARTADMSERNWRIVGHERSMFRDVLVALGSLGAHVAPSTFRIQNTATGVTRSVVALNEDELHQRVARGEFD